MQDYRTHDTLSRVLEMWGKSTTKPGHPAEWVRQAANIKLWSKQVEICTSVMENNKTAVQAGHGVGKSMCAAVIADWWIDIHPVGEAFVISTAPSTKQIHAVLWAEMARIHDIGRLAGEIQLSDNWVIGRTLVAQGRKPPDHNKHSFQGLHRKYVLVVIDEACHDDQTDVLTEHGWMRFAELTGNERLLTMDPHTHESRYTLPTRVIAKHYDGPMHYYDAKGMNYAVTPDHRMLYGQVKYGKPTKWYTDQNQNIETWNNKIIKKVIDWKVDDNPDLGDDWLSFLGWFGSEGWINKPLNTVGITQSENKEEYQEIFDLCTRLGFNPKKYGPQITMHSTKLARFLVQWGRTQLVRRVPDFVRMASARQINIYLDAYVKGDGYRHLNREIIYTSSPSMADDLQELILKTGMPSVVHKRNLEGQSNLIVDNNGLHIATSTVDGYVVSRPSRQSDAKMFNKNSWIENYKGTVYCATVPPDHLLFTRRNGYTMWSGNCGIPEWIWDAVETVTTGRYCRILAIGNPDDPSSHFAKVCKPGSGWHNIRISVFDNPNFTGEPVEDELKEALPGQGWVEDKKLTWGEGTPMWDAKVLGLFSELDEFAVIPYRWVSEAQLRYANWVEAGMPPQAGRKVIGADIARFGKNKTIFAHRQGNLISRLEKFSKQSTDIIADLLMARTDLHEDMITVDDNGVGGGVTDLLRRNGYTVRAFTAQARTLATDRSREYTFVNLRSAAWWNMRELLDPMLGADVMLVPDENLAAQLITPKWKIQPGAKIQVESKDDVSKRTGGSTDEADAVIMAFWYSAGYIGPEDFAAVQWTNQQVTNGAIDWVNEESALTQFGLKPDDFIVDPYSSLAEPLW